MVRPLRVPAASGVHVGAWADRGTLRSGDYPNSHQPSVGLTLLRGEWYNQPDGLGCQEDGVRFGRCALLRARRRGCLREARP